MRAMVLGKHSLAVVGVQKPREEIFFVLPLLGRGAEHLLDVRAAVDVRADLVEAVDVDGERNVLDELAIALLGFADGLLELLALRDVE
jgi:hypothetical protein